ncbi:MAG TPA: hypothetical protein VGB42_10525 [Candidatus Thermoplasmatota archaeon]
METGRPRGGRRLRPATAAALLALVAAGLWASGPAAALGEVTVEVVSISDTSPFIGDDVRLVLWLNNTQDRFYNSTSVIIKHGNTDLQRLDAIVHTPLGSRVLNITFVAKDVTPVDNTQGLHITVVQFGGAGTLLGAADIDVFMVQKPIGPLPPDYATPAAIGIGVAAAGVIGFLYMKKRKEDAARHAAEAAARAEIEARVKAEQEREAALLKKIAGKNPPEYYVRRRQRLALMVPAGLSSSGITILAKEKPLVVTEKIQVISCQRCGTQKADWDAPCPRCTITDAIDALKAEVRKARGHDFSDVSGLIQQAEFQLSYSDYEKCNDLMATARTVFAEILSGGERKTVVKKMETISAAQAGPKVLDIGIKDEHTATDFAAEERDHEAREEYAQLGNACPDCGHAMYGDLCAYDNFDQYTGIASESVEKAGAGGADTADARDLLERAARMREDGHKDTASRYLNRARYLAVTGLRDHLNARADGMIDYARVLMLAGEEDGVAADFAGADALINEADSARAAGDPETAIRLVAEAENRIQEALHDMARHVAIRRIDVVAAEIDEARAKGLNVETAEERLKEARSTFDDGEFEAARDTATTARKALEEAAKGKSECPKCHKPVQPTWARCPFCTTPLR